MSTKEHNPEDIFHRASEITDAKEREAYLDGACAGNAKLRGEVEALLSADEQAGSFLGLPQGDPDVTLDMSSEGLPGTKIGNYELLELIGEGGMGLVYVAQQKEPVRRRVALKIIKPGMDSKQVIARFEAERQTLAVLDHPNIAHVFDAGTTKSGRPYFIMEYVKGMSITRYCDEKKLDIEKRLRLFEQVCEGIHHAHQKGIIHRDLKPSNILVSVHGDRAVPKIIDFGIAKAVTQPLTDKTVMTFQGQLLGTPEYMSPEQVDLAMQDIDTRSDIYSLGVILYELLAGVLPFERESFARLGFAEIQRTIREEEPASPSTRLTSLGEEGKAIAASRDTHVVALARRLHRELEWIPLKAMRKDRCRRYKSASEMADDVRNYLNGNPLLAGPETAMYRMQKFVRKHAGSVATVLLVAAAIVLGLIVSTTMYFEAEEARKNEVIERTRAEAAEKVAQEQREVADEQRELAEERAEDYRRSLYIHRINLADVAYRDSNMRRLRKLLDSCPEDLRSWEWYRLNYISGQSLKTVLADVERVFEVAFAPDGKRFVSGGSEGTIKIWDAADGKELMVLGRHDFPVISIAFSPDGKRIASLSRDARIKVWDAQSGKELRTVAIDDSFAGFHTPWILGRIAFSPDSKKIASPSMYGTVEIWDADTGARLMTLEGHMMWTKDLAFSPDGSRIASCSRDKTFRIWDARTGRKLLELEGHEEGLNDIAFSPDGKHIASTAQDRTARVWDAATGAALMTLEGHEKAVGCVAYSYDGTKIATGDGEGKIKIWDAANGTELTTLLGHVGGVKGVAFSPDDKRLISGSYDGTVKVWPVGVDPAASVTLQGGYSNMALSPDGKYIVTSGGQDCAIRVWDAATREELMKIDGPGEDTEKAWGDISVSPDGKRIVSSYDNDIYVWDASSGKRLLTLSGHEDRPDSTIENDVWSLAYSPDGARIVSGGLDRTVRVWDAVTGAEVMTLLGHGEVPIMPELSPITSVTFSPDGQLIASGSSDFTVKIWNAKSGAEITTLKGHTSWVSDVAFSPDGRQVASSSGDRTIRVWDAATGSQLLLLKHEGEISCVTYSPDGKRIVSGSKDDTLRLWDAETGVEVLKLSLHGWPDLIYFSPDGKTLALAIATGVSSNRVVTLLESGESDVGHESQQVASSAREYINGLAGNKLQMKRGSYYELVSEIRDDETIGEAVRNMALQIAQARLVWAEMMFSGDFWPKVNSPDHNEPAYRKALEQAEKNAHAAPERFKFVVALGAAQYRVGAYEDAVATLGRAQKMIDESKLECGPAIEGYKAMALRRLGRENEADATLQQLRSGPVEQWLHIDGITFSGDEGGRMLLKFLVEVEKLFAGEDRTVLSIWELIEDGKLDDAGEAIEKVRSSKDSEDADRIEIAARILSILYYHRGYGHKFRSVEYPERIAGYENAVRIDPNNAQALDALGWICATCSESELRDGEKAVKAATRACELTKWQNYEYISTLAAAHSEAGDFENAVKRQKKAMDLRPENERAELQAEYEERLKLYESGKPYRESVEGAN